MAVQSLINRDFDHLNNVGNSFLSDCLQSGDHRSDIEGVKSQLKAWVLLENEKVKSGLQPSAATKVQ